MLLYGCDLRSAVRLAEDLRVRLATLDARDAGYAFDITASFGVTSAAQAGYVLERMLSGADLMLYRSKREGRNRVSVQPDGPGPREMAEPASASVSGHGKPAPRGGEPALAAPGQGGENDVRTVSLTETGIG